MNKKQNKTQITKKWWFWGIIAFVALGIIGAGLGMGNNQDDTGTSAPGANEASQGSKSSEAKFGDSEAELYCQDAALVGKFLDLNNIDIFRIVDQNTQTGKFGWVDANGNDIYYIRWNGKNKATEESIRFDCWVSGTSEEDVTLHRFEADGNRFVDTVETTVFEPDGSPVQISE